MRKLTSTLLLAIGAGTLASCGGVGGVESRQRPDEFAVQRQAPLVVPPDFNLAPPVPGAPRPTEGTSAEQALQALFPPPQRSALEINALRRAGTPDSSIRSTVGDPQTFAVDKGVTTRAIVSAPEGDGQAARAAIPAAGAPASGA